LTGCPPCSGTDAIDVLHKKAHEDPVPIGSLRPYLQPKVEELIGRALSRSPRDRHQSMTALKNDVMACLGVVDRAVTGPAPMQTAAVAAPQLATSTARVGRRGLGRGAIVAAGALIAVGGFAAYWLVDVTPKGDAAAERAALEPAAPAATAQAAAPAPAEVPG